MLRRMTEPRRLVSSTRAAAELGVHPGTLWRWHREDGKPTAALVTPGRHLRWNLDDLRRQIATMNGTATLQEEYPMAAPHLASDPEEQPVVAAIVTSHLGVLVGRRNDNKPPWTFIAGEVEPGEATADAAIREVKEETGLLVRAAAREIGRRVHPNTGRTMIYLACQPTEGLDVFVGDEDELAEVRWVQSMKALGELMPRKYLFDPVAEHLERLLSA